MDRERFARLQDWFQRAAELQEHPRGELLREARAEDPELADRLEELLRREDRARASIEARLDLVGARHPEHAEALRRLRSDLVRLGPLAGGPELSEAIGAELASWERRGGDLDELASTTILARLRGRAAPHERYLVEGEVGRGGMGTVLRVWDQDLRRPLAMKVRQRGPAGGRNASRGLARFLEEAQVTGRLDHPGIVPVHELGTDAEDQVYFTMKLVQGDDLETVFEEVAEGRRGWTLARAVRVLLRVCEAMGYAHAKGVLHRDLKPANVMVGRFGEVYVMDWGLARVMGRADTHDIRPRCESDERLDSELRSLAAARPDTPLVTMDGEVIGTPAYMPPEQARGAVEEMGPPSDVYAVGAILYRLLAGTPPYVERGARPPAHRVLLDLVEGPPRALEELAPDAPPELVSICEKAMARNPRERYADTAEMALDVEAWLEGRVVGAHERGAWAEARKWVQRNRSLAGALGASLVLALAGLGGVSYVQAAGRETAEAERAVAVRERNNVLRLSAFARLDELERRAEDLWPAVPERLGDIDAWIGQAERLVAGLDPDPAADDIGHLAQLEELERQGTRDPDAPGGWHFPDGESAWWHAELSDLVTRIRAFADERTGLAGSGVAREQGAWGVRRRREWAAGLEDLTRTGEEARRRWELATDAIADASRSPAYGGLELAAQRGLLPLGPDPDSGLWEFFHPATGSEPRRNADGRIAPDEESGLVFVLLPGGSFAMGAQSDDELAPCYDPAADEDEGPVHVVELSPFLIAKHEMTQGQWLRLKGRNPSLYSPERGYRGLTLRNPVENVTWEECRELLSRYELDLPTEAQWEYAARAGTSTVFSTGDVRESLLGHVNLADQAAARRGITWYSIQDWPELDDGWALHAPVGSFLPNAFGLHDVHGNVQEWCLDGRGDYGEETERDPFRFVEGPYRVYRGGGFQGPAADARSAKRSWNQQQDARVDVGLRPVRSLR